MDNCPTASSNTDYKCPHCKSGSLSVVYEADGIITIVCDTCDFYEVIELEKPHVR